MSGGLSNFVSEEEVKEQRERRQAEWEKVRKPDDPEGEFLVKFALKKS